MRSNLPATLTFAIAISGALTCPMVGQNQNGIPTRADNTSLDSPAGPFTDSNFREQSLTPFERAAQTLRKIPWKPSEPDAGSKPGLVSVNQLQHPLSKEGKRRIEGAREEIRKGKVQEGMTRLKAELADPSTAGYAHGILGTQYLRQGETQLAIDHLRQSVRVLPGALGAHYNLGYALCLVGSFQEAEEELRKALALDPDDSAAQYFLGLILLNRQAFRESLGYLALAQSSIHAAHLALAVLHARVGEPELADEQLLLYRPEASAMQPLREWISRAASLPQPAAAFGLRAKNDAP